MVDAALVFPHQLFRDHPALDDSTPVALVEADQYFTRFDYHAKKRVLHRASMQAYRERLEDQGYNVIYVEATADQPIRTALERLADAGHTTVAVADPIDRPAVHDLHDAAAATDIDLQVKDSSGFICNKDWLRDYFDDEEYFMQSFYKDQRRRLDILMDDGEPQGGKWSFDQENREALPDDIDVPDLPRFEDRRHVREAQAYVDEHWPDAPGSTGDFIYPVTHEEARDWLHDFLRSRFADFGDYQDAIAADEAFLFHSLLSPAINTGLLQPMEVVEAANEHADDHDVSINALEGFVRQIIGWREFMRAVYLLEGEEMRSSNFWGHDNDLPDAFYEGTTGLPPVDTVIERVLDNAYAHHIERLMVLGNIMTLCEIDPDAAYDWFMELFIDAYDWVMVPNLYGMSLYADGGTIVTKPYISSSNYINKMGDFDGGAWEDAWDGLYWRFIAKHRDVIGDNPRMAVMVSTLDRMGEETRQQHQENAADFLDQLLD